MSRQEFVHLADTQSLIRNSNFGTGVAYWRGSYVRHALTGATNPDVSMYGAELFSVPSGAYPSNQPVGMWQDLPSTLSAFPSERVVSNLEFIPFTKTSAVFKLNPGFSLLNGAVVASVFPDAIPLASLADFEPSLLFQHPFVFTEIVNGALKETRLASGTPLFVTDLGGATNSKQFNTAYLLLNYAAAAFTPGDTALVTPGAATYHALVGSTVNDELEPIVDSLNYAGSVAQVRYTGNAVQVDIFVQPEELAALQSVDRKQPSFPAISGLQLGDVFTGVGLTSSTGVINSVEWLSDRVRLTVLPLKNLQQVVTPFFETDEDYVTWMIFAPSQAVIKFSLPLFSYNYTAALTARYSDAYTLPAPPVIDFLELSPDGIDGFGAVNRSIPAVVGTAKTVYLKTGTGEIDQDFVRQIYNLRTESSVALAGKPVLRIASTDTALSGDTWLIASAGVNNSGGIPKVVFSFFVAPSVENVPLPLAAGKSIKLGVVQGALSQYSQLAWLQGVAGQESFVIDSSNISDTGQLTISVLWLPAFGTFSTSYISWTNAVFPAVLLAVQSVVVGQSKSLVTDICLYRGDFSNKFEILDDPTTSQVAELNNNSVIDPLINNLDCLSNVIPAGAVVLYAGGGVCPPGFKRVSELPGGGGVTTITPPSAITYDSASDISKLSWENAELDAVDSVGALIPLVGVNEAVALPVPGFPDILEYVVLPSYQKVVQPGQFLRVSSFELGQDQQNQFLISTDPGNARRLSGADQRITLPHFGELSTTPVTVELIFRFNGASTTPPAGDGYWLFTKYVALGSGNRRGYGIRVGAAGTIQAVAFVQAGATFRTVSTTTITGMLPNTLGMSNTGFVHVMATFFDSYDSTQGLSLEFNKGAPLLTVRTDGTSYPVDYAGHASSFFGSIASTNPCVIGYGATTTAETAFLSTPMDIDLVRVYKGAISHSSLLWNNGKGTPILPLTLQSDVLSEYLFNGVASGSVETYGGPSAIFTGANFIVQGVLGAINTNTPVTKATYREAQEDMDTSYLVTAVQSTSVDAAEAELLSAAPFDSTGNEGGSGASDVSISYPLVVGAQTTDLNDKEQGQAIYPPLGPSNVFYVSNGVAFKDGRTWEAFTDEVLFSGSVPLSIRVLQYGGAGITNPHPNNTTSWIPQVGDVVWLRWLQSTGGVFGAFLARLTGISSKTVNAGGVKDVIANPLQNDVVVTEYVFKRYDERALVFPAGHVINNNLFKAGKTVIRPAVLFGIGTQVRAEQGVINTPGVSRSKVYSGNTPLWVVRKINADVEVHVRGKFRTPSNVGSINVEPTGYVRYDESSVVDIGAGGHSHAIENDNGASTTDIPRIFSNTANNAAYPYVPVAAEHGHGFLGKYVYSLPKFRLFTLCQKL